MCTQYDRDDPEHQLRKQIRKLDSQLKSGKYDASPHRQAMSDQLEKLKAELSQLRQSMISGSTATAAY